MPHNIQAFVVFAAEVAVVHQVSILLSTEYSVPPRSLGHYLKKRQEITAISATGSTEKSKQNIKLIYKQQAF